MAYQKYYGYQYETSPRKIEPEYETYKKQNPYKNKKSTAKRKVNKKAATKAKLKPRVKVGLYIAIGFIVLLGISYRNSQIAESFSKKESLKEEVSSIQKENEQLKVNIESSLNLNNVEQMAKEKLGMQKLNNSQKIYVSLPKKDYIKPAAEEVEMENNLNFWQKLLKGLTESIK